VFPPPSLMFFYILLFVFFRGVVDEKSSLEATVTVPYVFSSYAKVFYY
jgi:hypothetical protein